MHRLVWLVFILDILVGACLAAAAEAPVTDYNRDIRPILSKHCFACHGSDDAHRKAGLRLDRRAAALAPLESGTVAIVPGKIDDSELYERVASDDEAARMPPKSVGPRLKDEEVALLKRWIEQGAAYAEHWAFVKPQLPAIPEVADRVWPKNPVDGFILARLERAGLKPSPEADRYELIRRLSLDLRGLPPSLEEIDAFATDERPEAYERLVDSFLADPAYGERWARMWLDLARYADSAGYGSDPLRTIWRYRDWVIDAFNANKPFDQFTIEQLAGDLLPEPALDQLVATAFHRNTMTNTEGGTDDEEFRVAAVKDRVDTTLQVWMGLTMGCAKCHNHKYDPISQTEYYQLYGFFNQTADSDRGDEFPTMAAPDADYDRQFAKFAAQLADIKRRLDEPTPELAAAQSVWEAGMHSAAAWTALDLKDLKSAGGATFRPLDDRSILVEGANPDRDVYTATAETSLAKIAGFKLEALPDPSLPAGGSGRAADGAFVVTQFTIDAGDAGRVDRPPLGRFVRIELPGDQKMLSLAEVQVISGGSNVARSGKASQSSTDYEGAAERAIDGNTDGDYHKARSTTHTKAESNPWWEVDLGEPRPLEQIVVWNRTDGDTGPRLAGFRVVLLDGERRPVWEQVVAEPPKAQQTFSLSALRRLTFSRAFATFSQAGFSVDNLVKAAPSDSAGWAVGPQQIQPQAAVVVPAAPMPDAATTRLVIRLAFSDKPPHAALGRFRVSVTADPAVIERASVPPDLLAIVDTPVEQRPPEQTQRLAGFYRSIAPALKPLRDEMAQLEKNRPVPPTLPILRELADGQRRKTHLLIKGSFLNPGPEVEPAVPAALSPFPPDSPKNRLGVARWLVHPDNPLTARVTVNRFWAQLFGAGLVETEEDFGTQGSLPTHPELLDWLALDFSTGARPWDVKKLLRLLTTSAAYRQSSRVTPALLEHDPRNRLTSRGPRFRLEAEMVRDQALALAGLLSRKMHGPSVYPPQPPGLWQAAFNGQRTWATSTGDDRYRRAIYTFWRRTVPYPSMATFDAPSRETCALRRIRTNTPLQAFVTLNDPVYVEAAQALARRIAAFTSPAPAGAANAAGESSDGVRDRAAFGLKLCLARPPRPEQVAALVELYSAERTRYQADPTAAAQVATDPLGPLPAGTNVADLAAWTVVANVLLNLDVVLTK